MFVMLREWKTPIVIVVSAHFHFLIFSAFFTITHENGAGAGRLETELQAAEECLFCLARDGARRLVAAVEGRVGIFENALHIPVQIPV
jgi:hypothetical protein